VARAGAMARNPRAIGIFNKVGGRLLIGAGVAAATIRAGQG
jgi:threonine/homoserine/homoserine lactone efflux protein